MKRALALLAAVLICGCGQATGLGTNRPTALASPGLSGSATATPLPTAATAEFHLRPAPAGSATDDLQIRCNGVIGPSDPVAIVQLHNGSTALRDYANVNHPVTACTFGFNPYELSLVDARHVIVPGHASGLAALVTLPEVRPFWFRLPSERGTLLAVAPDLQSVAWINPNIPLDTDEIHIVSAAGDSMVTSVPNPHSGRCGSPDDSNMAGYTRSASDLFVLDQPAPPWNSLVVLQGKQVALRVAPADRWATGAQPAMALWSPTSETLYYRKDGSVWRWTPAGGSVQFLPNVNWYYPTISADGHYLAYAVPESSGVHDVYLMDLSSGAAPRKIGKGNRTLPAFLNATQLWYKSEQLGPCGPGGNQPLVYDVNDGSESPSVIDMPISVWPATSSNF
jgi:hypothetical protein